MFCTNCGNGLPDAARFCPQCGSPVEAPPVGEPARACAAETGTADPRDFLAEARGWLKAPRPLRDLLSEDKPRAMQALLGILREGGTYERKYAAFALGQVGEACLIGALESQLEAEPVEGVREAIQAALVALREVPIERGYSELDRRTVIEDVYGGKPPRIWHRR